MIQKEAEALIPLPQEVLNLELQSVSHPYTVPTSIQYGFIMGEQQSRDALLLKTGY